MNCRQAQRSWDDLAAGRLDPPNQTELRRHLADCTDCRVAHQRAVRLQQLLALKRYETPGPEYFDRFLPQFHQRLAQAESGPSFWARWAENLGWDQSLWRWGLATATTVSLLVAAGFYWPRPQSERLAVNQSSSTQTTTVAVVPGAVVVANGEPTPLPAGHGLVPIAPVVSNQPRYVLDRFSLTPASYESGSVRF